MDRLLEVSDTEIRIEFELRSKCRARIKLRNRMPTAHVAFKVQTTSPKRFSVKPPNGYIPPLGEFSFDVVLMPQTELPEVFPKSRDKFLVKSAISLGGSQSGLVPEKWFASRKKHLFLEGKLKVVYTGPFLLRQMVVKGDVESVKYMIPRQGRCNATDASGRTALHIAAASGNVEMVNLLLESGATVDATGSSGQTALLEAVYMGHFDIVSSLLLRGANTEAHNPRGWTAIHLAASWNHVDILKLLIERDSNLEARDSEGRTALHFAVTQGHVDCVKLLLDAGIDKDARSDDGRTALYRAAAKDDSQLVELLLDWDANKGIKTVAGKTPYDIAVEKGHGAAIHALELGRWATHSSSKGGLQSGAKVPNEEGSSRCWDKYGWIA